MLYAILCVPRSGSSLVASLVHAHGISCGGKLSPGNHWNPQGFYACQELQEILIPVVRTDTEGHIKIVEDELPGMRIRLLAYFDERRKEGDICIKTAELAPVWSTVLECWGGMYKVITTTRDLTVSATSWRARKLQDFDGSWTEEYAENFMKDHEAAVKAALWSTPTDNILTLDYETMLDNAERDVARIADFIGKPVHPRAVERVQKELRRF